MKDARSLLRSMLPELELTFEASASTLPSNRISDDEFRSIVRSTVPPKMAPKDDPLSVLDRLDARHGA